MKLRPSTHPPRLQAFTLIEIMIVVAIIALLASIAVPSLIRARKRAQGAAVRNDLRLIDYAIDEYGTENNLQSGATVTVTAWKGYLKPNSLLYSSTADIFGDYYGNQKVGTLPAVPSSAWDQLIDVCDSSFWAPYTRSP